ncbi:MAG: heparan-alpha-glucosaminide N-acetyltransferase, partial [Rhodoferax sp.]|nr:heparan-alpha-glucosaminide N-acetyltransferase [Rhodoferax sp.]
MPMPKPDIHPSRRYAAVDALRGLAMVWMTVFHFCFDLQHFDYLNADFYTDRFWTWQRVGIVSLFVFCAGLGQAIAAQQGQTWARFWRRWRQIALSAMLVSLGSWWMFPQSYIYFGILHGMAVMLILARL